MLAAISTETWLGLLVATLFAACLILIDFHRFVVKLGNGTAPTHYLISWQPILFFTTYCILVGSIFIFVQYNPDVWFSIAITLGRTNIFFKGMAVAAMTATLFRSKILDTDNGALGAEYLYDYARGWAVNHYKVKAASMKSEFCDEASRRASEVDDFEGKIFQFTINAINHDESKNKNYTSDFEKIKNIKDTFLNSDRYCDHLLSLSVDYLNIKSVKLWMEKII